MRTIIFPERVCGANDVVSRTHDVQAREIPILRWVTLNERKWVTSRERRSPPLPGSTQEERRAAVVPQRKRRSAQIPAEPRPEPAEGGEETRRRRWLVCSRSPNLPRPNQRLDNVQTEPDTALSAREGSICLLEPVEDSPARFFRNAIPGVHDANLQKWRGLAIQLQQCGFDANFSMPIYRFNTRQKYRDTGCTQPRGRRAGRCSGNRNPARSPFGRPCNRREW